MSFKFHCDKCGKYVGDYLYGIGGVEEKANITNRYIEVNDYDKYGRVTGKKRITFGLPDIVCFNCTNQITNII